MGYIVHGVTKESDNFHFHFHHVMQQKKKKSENHPHITITKILMHFLPEVYNSIIITLFPRY